MTKKTAIILLAIGLTMYSCSTEETLCEAALCAAPVATLKIKLIDKNTSKNLLDKQSTFKLSDLSISSSAYNTALALKIDSTELNNKYVTVLSSGNETFTLKYKDYPSDRIDIRSRLVKSGCCNILNVQSITVNDKPACEKCSGVEVIEIRK